MSARDELADIIAEAADAWLMGPITAGTTPEHTSADAVLAAGYVKHRTITTVDELDALPLGSVVIDRDRDICQRFRGGWRATIHESNDDPWLTDTLEVDLPATVLYSPEASA
jgi:hypothetical protein